MKDFFKYLFDSILYFLFPLKCLNCHKLIPRTDQNTKITDSSVDKSISGKLFEKYFCSDCITQTFEFFEPPFCERCGKKFEYNEYAHAQNHFCEDCLKSKSKIGRVRAGARYSGIVKESIQHFKYQKKLALAKPLEKILFSGFNEYFDPSNIDLIIPVPLHASKLRQRGFNQSFLVIKNFIKMLKKINGQYKLEIDYNSLKRVKKTNPQIQFTAEQRKENVKNAFKIVNKEKIKNKKILLIDDVFTTGATSTEAASELLCAGALSVDVLVIARA